MKIKDVKEMIKIYCEDQVNQMQEDMQQYITIFNKRETVISSKLNIILEVYEKCKERMYGYYRATMDIIEITNNASYSKLSDILFPVYTEYRDKANEIEREISDKLMKGIL